MNPLTAMRKTTSLALLLLLGGCASAGAPAPATLESAPVSVDVRPLKADSPGVTQKIVEIHTGACETNDRMAVGTGRVAPQGHPGVMPGMRMDMPVAPMPNACPVTVPATGQMFYHAGPGGTVYIRGPKSIAPGTAAASDSASR